MTEATTIVAYGKYEIDFTAIPQTSLATLVRSGLAHKLGNEVSSKVGAAAKRAEAEGTEFNRAETEEAFRQAMLDAILAGTLGVSTRTPAGPKADTVLNKIVVAHIASILKAHKMKVPSGDKTVEIGGRAYTRADLLATQMAKHGERFKAEAEKEHKRLAKEAARAGEVQVDLTEEFA